MMRTAWLLGVLTALLATAACAQAPGGMTRVAPPETLTAVLTAPPGSPVPHMDLAVPDTLVFGAPLRLSLDFDTTSVPADSILSKTPWLHVTPVAGAEGTVLELRCWRAGPWRLAWADPSRAGPVLETRGRLSTEAASAPVRDPWRPARDLRLLVLAALLLTALLVGAALAWRHRGRGLRRLDEPAPDAAWALFATRMAPALAAGQPRDGETSAYLTLLAGSVRAYLARRYAVTTAGLTGGDVADAVTARQYPGERVTAFDAILADCDRLRFDPRPPSLDLCRRLTAVAVAAVASDRGGAAPADATAAAAWARLRDICRAWTGEDPTISTTEVRRA